MQHSWRYLNNIINWLLHILCILVYFTYNQYFEVFCYNLYLAPSNLVSTTIRAVWPPVQIRNCLYAGYAGLHWHLNSTNKTKKIVLSVKFSEITQTRQKGKNWQLRANIENSFHISTDPSLKKRYFHFLFPFRVFPKSATICLLVPQW